MSAVLDSFQAESAARGLLPGAQPLAQWVLNGGRAAYAPWGWRLQLRWHAWWAAKLWQWQLPRLLHVQPKTPPVLVLGLWRSGTTLLHERLSALSGHQSTKTWQCFHPHSFALSSPHRGATQSARRPMDGGVIHAASAQEDEFALLLLGAPSLYRGFIDPRRLGELAASHFGPTLPATPVWAADWLRFLAGVEAQGGGRRLILKSPNHIFRLQELQSVLPTSPRIWIGRPLSSVWFSNLRMWRAMFKQYALWPCPKGELEAFVTRCVQRYAEVLCAALAQRSGPATVWVDFSDLAQSPLDSLQALACFCNGPDRKSSSEELSAVLEAHRAHDSTALELPLPAGLLTLAAELESLHAQARARWGWRTLRRTAAA